MNTPINDGGSAFPLPGFPHYVDGIPQPLCAGYGWGEDPKYGMTLRDWFAGMALSGYAGVPDERSCPKDKDQKQWASELAENDARYCYFPADAMIKARKGEA